MSKVPFAEYKIGFEKFLKLNMFGKKGEKFSLVKDLKSE